MTVYPRFDVDRSTPAGASTRSSLLRFLCASLAVLLVSLATPAGSFQTDERGDSQQASAEDRRAYTNERLRGKIVWMSDALKRRFGVIVDEDAARTLAALETKDGRLFPIVKDARGRGFHKDERLRGAEMELEVRRYAGSPMIQIIRTYTLKKTGTFLLDYWCDICAIPMYELKECECCQGPIRLRERKVNEKTGEILGEE